VPTTKLTPFVGSKDEWDTKEDPGKSMKNVMISIVCIAAWQKAEATSNCEKIKPIALEIVELRESELRHQSCRQLVN